MSDGLKVFLCFAGAIVIGILILRSILRRPPTPGRTFGFLFVGPEKFVMAKTFVQGSSHTATVVFTDPQGVVRPLPTGNIPAWTVAPADAAALSPAPDGMSCPFVVGTSDEDFTLTCTVEGDPTPGVDTIVVNFAGTVVDPEDTQGTITVV